MLICGVDEAGRGPLAGPVVAAAVILDPSQPIEGLNDSKKLSEKKRLVLSEAIKAQALAWSIAQASVEEIDEINILHASMLAMNRAIAGLHIKPERALIDGNRIPPQPLVPCQAIVGGDALHECISAASILAKVERDRQMIEWHEVYPEYGFNKHKAYGTKAHLEALRAHGPCPLHRRSFKPVQQVEQR